MSKVELSPDKSGTMRTLVAGNVQIPQFNQPDGLEGGQGNED